MPLVLIGYYASYVLETVSLVLISKCLIVLILLAEPAGHSLTEIIPSKTCFSISHSIGT